MNFLITKMKNNKHYKKKNKIQKKYLKILHFNKNQEIKLMNIKQAI